MSMTWVEWEKHRTLRFKRSITRYPRMRRTGGGWIEVEVIEALVPHECENIESHRVVFHTCATREGYDGLSFNGTWFQDKSEDDLFCSEMFAELTGKYPYEVREVVEPEIRVAELTEGVHL